MEDRIIRESIDSLRQDGLKFSVDTLAEKLKISKKTIYKHFPNKEALATSLYDAYYADLSIQVESIGRSGRDDIPAELLLLYFDSKVMTRAEIFNKYKLNEVIHLHISQKGDALWAQICSLLHPRDPGVLRIIVDGALEKLCSEHLDPHSVIERLVELL
ncbi:MAG: TetR/AcrR family transcriptional regulator [Candidatus Faecivicinus sp.]